MLSSESLLGLITFALVSSITPGPNNIMLLASGVNFGFRPTIPHLLGISFGFFILALASGLGVGAILQQFPALHSALKIISAAYLAYLALKIARDRTVSQNGDTDKKPMSFLQAALFQWVNPKAWMIAISVMIIFGDSNASLGNISWIALIFSLVGLPCIAIWAVFGVLLKQILSQPVYLKWFNISMGALLIASIYPVFYS